MLKNNRKYIYLVLSMVCFMSHSYSVASEAESFQNSDFKQKKFYKVDLSSFYQSLSVNTEESDITNKSSGSFNYFGFGLDALYSISSKFDFHLAYLYGNSSSSSNTYDGVELGLRYYYFGSGRSKFISTPSLSVSLFPSVNFWVESNYKSIKLEGETTFVRYVGLNLKTGGEFHLFDKLYISAGVGMDMLTSGDFRTMNTISGILSIGKRSSF